ncbi:hypothetical protein [Micromonospora aurantiaca]|uniref:hypothetical protein n=1 Tax=Micromonospora aurantiaca (nom. illeg.) TaxID=47850 RepID=UPI0037F34A0B
MAPPVGEDLWYSPDDQWPRHKNQALREAAARLRSAGWHLKQTTSHGFARAFCRRTDDNDACKVIIDTTPQDPESRAKDMDRALRDCKHRFSDQADDLRYASELLDGAQQLLDAVEDLLDAEAVSNDAMEAWQRAEELLEVAEENAAEFERVAALAAKFDEEARRLTEAGWLKGVEIAGPDASIAGYVSSADERTLQAGRVVAEAPYHADPALLALQERHVGTKGRIILVRERLGHKLA